MAKQGHKISFLKILNYTSPPPLINYDQSLNKYKTFSVFDIQLKVNALPKVVGFPRVLRFPPTGKVDRVG
jgi:hypothetical protein